MKKMTHSEAGKLGGIAWAKRSKEEKAKRVEQYNDNPILCLNCNDPLSYDQNKRKMKFCGQSCNAIYYNARRIKGKKNNCLSCGNKTYIKYCSSRCQQQHKYKTYITEWLEGKESGTVKTGCSITIKKYLKESRGNECELCGWKKINQYTNNVPVEIDHIDGNYQNNRPENLRVICPNCHSLTKTYKALNSGNGRKYRKTI